MNKKKLGGIIISLVAAGSVLVGGASCKKKKTEPTPAEVTYTVNFETDKGIAPQSLAGVTSVTALPTLTADGFIFEGWFYSNGTKANVGDTITSNVVLTAKWKQVFTITYSTKYGTAPAVVSNTTTIESLPELTSDNATFEGWYYENGNKAVVGDTITSNVTLTAKWTDVFTITYETKYATAPAVVTKTTKITSLPELTSDNAIFEGWYYENGTKANLNDEITSNVKLVAKWIDVYSVSFVTNNGTEIESYKDTKIATLPTNLTKDYYTFEGWYKEFSFVNKVNLNDEITADTVLYAKWSKVDIFAALSKSENIIIKSTFDSGSVSTSNVIKKGLFATTETVVDGVLNVNDKAYANIGYGYSEETISMYVEITRELEGDPLSESNFDYITIKNGDTSVISISVTQNNKLKVGTEIFDNVTVSENFSVLLNLNVKDKKLEVVVNNDVVTKKDLALAYFTTIEFKAYENAIKLDNLIVISSQTDLETYKSRSLTALDLIKLNYMNSTAVYKTVKPNIEAKYNELKPVLKAATDMASIDSALTNALEALYNEFTNQDKILNDSKTLAINELGSYVNLENYSTDNQTAISSMISSGITEINKKTSPADVDSELAEIKAAIDEIPTIQAQYNAEIANYVGMIEIYKEAANYTFNKEEYEEALESAKALISAVKYSQYVQDNSVVHTVYVQACALIDEVEDDVAYFTSYKALVLSDIDKYADSLYKFNDDINEEGPDYDTITDAISNAANTAKNTINAITVVSAENGKAISAAKVKYIQDLETAAGSLRTLFGSKNTEIKNDVIARCNSYTEEGLSQEALEAKKTSAITAVESTGDISEFIQGINIYQLYAFYLTMDCYYNFMANAVLYGISTMQPKFTEVKNLVVVTMENQGIVYNESGLDEIITSVVYGNYHKNMPEASFNQMCLRTILVIIIA